MRAGLFADEFARFSVLLRQQVTHDTAILRLSTRLQMDAWGELFTPMQALPPSFCVMVRNDTDSGPPTIKPYTPIEVGSDFLDLLVKAYPTGSLSRPLFAKQPGEHVLMQGPRIKFDLEKGLGKPRRLIALAGGTGIAPIYQVFKAERLASLPKVLIFANKSKADQLLSDELGRIQNLTIRHVLEDREGFVTKAHLPTINDQEDAIFLCGPRPFNEHIRTLLPSETKIITF